MEQKKQHGQKGACSRRSRSLENIFLRNRERGWSRRFGEKQTEKQTIERKSFVSLVDLAYSVLTVFL